MFLVFNFLLLVTSFPEPAALIFKEKPWGRGCLVRCILDTMPAEPFFRSLVGVLEKANPDLIAARFLQRARL